VSAENLEAGDFDEIIDDCAFGVCFRWVHNIRENG
jgi:hypothetical protein|tara:strand:+ start:198 stop:302 length:105 start_codon:yes stop_codon:yes gene_type:complete